MPPDFLQTKSLAKQTVIFFLSEHLAGTRLPNAVRNTELDMTRVPHTPQGSIVQLIMQ